VFFGLQITALTLLKEEDFPSLGCLLDREFRPLSHLLVLLGWTHCQSLESAKRLLQTLHRTQVTLTLPPGLFQK
jgi:zinc finger FYVE domain-containing protein 26